MTSRIETAQRFAGKTQESATRILSHARSHPVPWALIGAGLAWLVVRSRRDSVEYDGSLDTYGDYVSEYEAPIDNTLRIRRMAEHLSEAASTTAGKLRSAASSARAQAGDVALSARQKWERAESSLGRWTQENPLAVGAAALSLGVAVGLGVQRSEVDRALRHGRRAGRFVAGS